MSVYAFIYVSAALLRLFDERSQAHRAMRKVEVIRPSMWNGMERIAPDLRTRRQIAPFNPQPSRVWILLLPEIAAFSHGVAIELST